MNKAKTSWNELMDPVVTDVKVYPNYQLEVKFETGEARLFDMTPLLSWPCYQVLKDIALFSQAFIKYDTVHWPGDRDIDPCRLYDEGTPIA